MHRFYYFFTLTFFADSAFAYVGPGLGLGVIGAVVGIVLTVLFAVIGLFWYPIKRMIKNKNKTEDTDNNDVS